MNGYGIKLKDPRWQKKRLEILSRDDFSCQACGDKEATLHVHHKAYSGEPWEVTDDKLITLCEGCHKKAENGFAIYMAGKINYNCWRHRIVPGLREHMPKELSGEGYGYDYQQGGPIIERAVFGLFDYCGPFFVSDDHGCFHVPNTHALGEGECGDISMSPEREQFVAWFAMAAIKRAGLVIVWLEPETCLSAYGTIAEIGAAHALNKPIVIGTNAAELPRDIWFSLCLGMVYYNLSNPTELIHKGMFWANHVW